MIPFPFYKLARRSIFCLSFFAAMGSVSFAAAESCKAEFKMELEKLDIPAERIKDSYTLDIFETAGSRILRVEGWMSFNDCKGNLVMVFDKSCLFGRRYTTSECKVPGVKQF